MRSVTFQGTALSASQKNAQAMRNRLTVQQARSPLLDVPTITASDWELRQFWNMVSDFKRYGYCEFQQASAPFVGEAFGY